MRTWIHPMLTCLLLTAGVAALAHAQAQGAPSGAHVTLHHWPPGLPNPFDADHYDVYVADGPGWECLPAAGSVIPGSPSSVTVTCNPTSAGVVCTSVQAGGYHVHYDQGSTQTQLPDGTLTVKAACTGLAVSLALKFPTNDPGVSALATGTGAPAFTCTADASGVTDVVHADFWIYCDVTGETSGVPDPVTAQTPGATVDVPVGPIATPTCDLAPCTQATVIPGLSTPGFDSCTTPVGCGISISPIPLTVPITLPAVCAISPFACPPSVGVAPASDVSVQQGAFTVEASAAGPFPAFGFGTGGTVVCGTALGVTKCENVIS